MGCANAKTSSVSNPRKRVSSSESFDLQQSAGFGRDISNQSTVSGGTMIEDGELDVIGASWSSWMDDDPAPHSPPTRRTHEAYNEALQRFLKQVGRKPKRFEQIVGIYRERSGYAADGEECMAVVTM
mmetsp:Transcript_78138/g.108578  ORF Transcript_78138/g.108578 Transcript_78138/m.108578 type:complete len:127 (+) Transcript_78138:2-382(+)